MNEKYERIIDLPHHTSKNRVAMAKSDRAAQFAPYAALSGYEAAVDETARLTEKRTELDEYEKEALNGRLIEVINSPEDKRVAITFFVPDKRKAGGAYVTVRGSIGLADEIKREIVLTNGRAIPIDEIVAIEEDENEP